MKLYILQFSLFLAVFYIVYLVFLKKETFFQYNRWYLLVTPCLALILPFVTLDFLRPKTESGGYFVNLPPVLLGDFATTETKAHVIQQAANTASTGFSTATILLLLLLYGIGCSIALFFLLKKAYQFRKFRNQGNLKEHQTIAYYQINHSRIACTFFNQIFIGNQIKAEERTYILQHELVHVKQYHTVDLLFFELLKLAFWFHPAIYAYQKQVSSLHEFIADEAVTRNTSKITYYQNLLNVAFGTHQISFINQFFNHSLIKKRIVMLQKTKSSKTAKLKYLMVLPLMAFMLTYVSCLENEETVENNQSELPAPPPPPAPPADLPQKDAQIINQLHTELMNMKEEGKSMNEIAKVFYDVNIHEITPSRENYYRSMLYMKYTYQNYNNSIDSDKKIEDFEIIPYDEYLKFRKHTKNALLPPPPPPATYEEGIPFTAIEKVPTYPGCDQASTNEVRKKCMSNKIKDFVNSNFNTKAVENNAKEGVNRVYVQFTISKDGSLKDIQSRAAHPTLAEEAKRVVKMLPKMQPGMQDGKPVNVLYSLPIIFQKD